MAEEIRPELLSFLVPSGVEYSILVVESLSYLPGLRELFPKARLYACTEEAERFAPYEDTGTELLALDYLATPLPLPRGSLDYIIGDLTLEPAGNPQDIAAGFSTFLKETGSFLTSFRNIRHWSVLEDLQRGHYYNVAARLYALPEFETLLSASYYKNMTARPQTRLPKLGSPILGQLEAAEFVNTEDLTAEFYIVKADRSMPELALLKSMFTAQDRKTLSRLLHRIEYGVAPAESVAALWTLYDRIGLFPDYLASFVNEAVYHPVRFYRALWQECKKRRWLVRALLQAGIQEALSPGQAQRLGRLLMDFDAEEA